MGLRRFLLVSLSALMVVVGCQTAPLGHGANPDPAPATPVVASRPAPAVPALGTNLASVKDWSTALPLLDAFKSSRRWITQCTDQDPDCDGGWSTDEYDRLALDDHGWVMALPAPADPERYTRVSTLMFRDVEAYPGGEYVVLYEGEGRLEYGMDARKLEAASVPGRDLIQVTPSMAGILLTITETDPNGTGNYIRNIHVVPAAYETTFATEIFNPEFVARIAPFQALRFMDWMETNNSEISQWEERPHLDDATYTTHGVPLELMLTLANRLQVDPWFCLPHQATDDYIQQAAEMVKAELDPALTAYVEFSNEVWNWQFDQAHYALAEGKARWGQEGNAYMQWYGMRAAQMSDLWHQVFADAPDRLITVIATQTGYRGLETAALDCPLWVAEGNAPCYQHGFGIYGITGYFTGGINKEGQWDQVESWLQDGDGGFERAFSQIETDSRFDKTFWDSLPGLVDTFAYHQRVAQQHGLILAAYEGGQHLVASKNDTLTEFFIAMNRHPRMADLYRQLLDTWVAGGGGCLCISLTLVARVNGAVGGRWRTWTSPILPSTMPLSGS